eukprot:10849961-Heterocapsa_arctica.AAC.1
MVIARALPDSFETLTTTKLYVDRTITNCMPSVYYASVMRRLPGTSEDLRALATENLVWPKPALLPRTSAASG